MVTLPSSLEATREGPCEHGVEWGRAFHTEGTASAKATKGKARLVCMRKRGWNGASQGRAGDVRSEVMAVGMQVA